MWRYTWLHWTPAGPVRFTVARHWNHSPRWVSMKASAFLSPQRPWQCVLCSCPSARWDPRLRRSYWWVWSTDKLHRLWNWDSEPTDDGSRRTEQDWFYSLKLLHCWCAGSLIKMQTLDVCYFRAQRSWAWQTVKEVQRWSTTGCECRCWVGQSCQDMNRRPWTTADTTTARKSSRGPELW